MLSKEQASKLLQNNRTYLATEFGVGKIALFGSCAKNNSNEMSDIDILVDFERPIGLRFIELINYLENLLGCHVDVLTSAGIQSIRIKKVSQSIIQSLVYV